jgi:dihydroxy-acid dehydratase
VPEAEIRRRLTGWQPPPRPRRGYMALYRNTVLQAPQGCDLDFLAGEAPEDRPTTQPTDHP